MLEKPGAQNIATFENQGKQHKFSDHWKSIWTGDDTKKTIGLTGIQVLTKDFTPYTTRYKYLRRKRNEVSSANQL